MGMNVIAKRTLREFWVVYPDSQTSLEEWFDTMSKGDFANFAEIKSAFSAADWVKGFMVFDIRGNHYRIIATARFERKTIWIKAVLTHKQYDSWTPEE